MNENIEKRTQPVNNLQESITLDMLDQYAYDFLGEEIVYIKAEIISRIIIETEKELPNIREKIIRGDGRKIVHNKYKDGLTVGNENNVTIGEVVTAKRLGIDVVAPEELGNSGDGKKTFKLLIEAAVKEHLFTKLNKELAKNFVAIKEKHDALKAKSFSEIEKRAGLESEQLGVFAEQIVIGILECIAIDHHELGFKIQEANAYLDANNKIDFIIHTKEKNKGVGINKKEVEFSEKSIGIQFTIHKGVRERKESQIADAKRRGVWVDDIIYVDLDNKILEKTVIEWKTAGKPIAGPWKFLKSEIRTEMLMTLFQGLNMTPEQMKSLEKIAEKK